MVAKMESTEGRYPHFQKFIPFIDEKVSIITLPTSQTLLTQGSRLKGEGNETTHTSQPSVSQFKSSPREKPAT